MAGMLGHDELERRLGFHPGTPETAPLYEANRAAALELARLWDDTLPPSRELACAQTALQEALMWANAAVATNLAPLGPERGAGHPAAAPLCWSCDRTEARHGHALHTFSPRPTA